MPRWTGFSIMILFIHSSKVLFSIDYLLFYTTFTLIVYELKPFISLIRLRNR